MGARADEQRTPVLWYDASGFSAAGVALVTLATPGRDLVHGNCDTRLRANRFEHCVLSALSTFHSCAEQPLADQWRGGRFAHFECGGVWRVCFVLSPRLR